MGKTKSTIEIPLPGKWTATALLLGVLIIPFILIVIFGDSMKSITLIDNSKQDFMGLLGTFAVVVAVVERFLEVFVNATRKPTTIRLEHNIKKSGIRLTKNNKELAELRTEQQKTLTAVSDLKSLILESQKKLKALKAEKNPDLDSIAKADAELKAQKARLSSSGENLSKLEEEINGLKTDAHDLQHKIDKFEEEKNDFKTGTRILTIRLSFVIGIIVGLVGIRILDLLIDPKSIEALPDIQENLFRWVDVLLTGGLIAGGSSGIHEIFRIYESFTNRATDSFKKEEPAAEA